MQKRYPDGAVCSYIETRGIVTTITLANHQGNFELFPDKKLAFKLNFDQDAVIPDLMEHATFSMKEGRLDGRPCYIVTAASHPTERQIDETLKMQRRLIPKLSRKKLREQTVRHLRRTKVFYIDKGNFFIYRHDVFDSGGRLMHSFSRTDVDFNPDIDDDIFKLPHGYSLEVMDSFDGKPTR